MIRRRSHAKPPKTDQAASTQAVFDWVLPGLCLGILALRLTVTESPTSRLSTLSTNLHDLAYSLTLSMLLLTCAAIWAIRALHGRTRTCRTFMELGISLFVLGGLISICFASDRRAAISDLLVQTAPMAMAWLLIQWLNTSAKIRLVLALIAVLGLVSAYESYTQFSTANQDTIDQYERNPEQFLDSLGVSPGTFEHFLFEHRLYSKGVSSFFTTRNSNGCFLLMAVLAALALTVEGAVQYRQRRNSLIYAVVGLLVTLVNLNALFLTRSKGALGAIILACLGLGLTLAFGRFLRAHARIIVTICLLGGVLAGAAIIYSANTQDDLPGGNSFLVRRQYWQATLGIVAQHPLTGAGPGNFAQAYHRFKPAASPESVADPHNWVLSLLSQYGPLGLIGFVLAVAWPLTVVTGWAKRTDSPRLHDTEDFNKRLYLRMTLAVCVLLLVVKPLLGMIIQDPLALIVLTSLVQVVMIIAGLLVLLNASTGQDTESQHCAVHWIVPIMIWAVIAVLCANLIDFALFEPGVLTCFWAIVACLMATYRLYENQDERVEAVPTPTRWPKTWAIVAILMICGLVGYGPVLISTIQIGAASQAWASNDPVRAHETLDRASGVDWLSDTACYQNGRMYLSDYEKSPEKRTELLHRAKACFELAIRRNGETYRNHERLADACTGLDPNTALAPALRAVELYPGNARLRVKLGQLYEQLGRQDQAGEAFRAALDIEEAFQQQFKIMYPDKPLIHRLEKAYMDAATAGLRRLKAKG